MALSPDGKTLATLGVFRLDLWDARTGESKAASLHRGSNILFSSRVAFSADGTIMATPGFHTASVLLWPVSE